MVGRRTALVKLVEARLGPSLLGYGSALRTSNRNGPNRRETAHIEKGAALKSWWTPHLGFEDGVPDTPGGGVQLIDVLSTAIAIYAGCVALVAAGCFARRRPRPEFLDKLVLVLEGALIVRAMLGVGAMATHAHAYPGATHVAYLITSVAILPVTMAFVTEDRSHWSAAVVVIACVALVVIAVRVQMTWSGHA